jgi:hypothetical protein
MVQRRTDRWVKAGAGAVLAALVLAACSSEGGTGAQRTTSPVRPTSTARLAIVRPTSGEEVAGPSVELEVSLEGAKIVPTTTTRLTADTGHLHVYLDDSLVSMTFGLDQQIPGISPGQHVLRVEFVAADHVPFDPRVFQSVIFEVKP